MNQTTEDSRQILFGGDTIVLEDGRLEMPPEQAKNTSTVVKNIEEGNFITIQVGNCKAEDILSKEQMAILKTNRESRKTRQALSREKTNQR